jgi:hypothetical protein
VLLLTRFSGCLAYLTDDFIQHDTELTVTFLLHQASVYALNGNGPALAVIQAMFESLMTYHIPAEFVLGTISKDHKDHMDRRYNPIIGWINDVRQGIQPAAMMDENLVTPLLDEIIAWTT